MSDRWEREEERRERDAEDDAFYALLCGICETKPKDTTRTDSLCTRCGANADIPEDERPHYCPGCGGVNIEDDRTFCDGCRATGENRRRYAI